MCFRLYVLIYRQYAINMHASLFINLFTKRKYYSICPKCCTKIKINKAGDPEITQIQSKHRIQCRICLNTLNLELKA